MTKRSAAAVFNTAQFRADIAAYQTRQHLSTRQLAATANLDPSCVRAFMRGDRDASLLIACAAADLCDLALDDYRRAPTGIEWQP